MSLFSPTSATPPIPAGSVNGLPPALPTQRVVQQLALQQQGGVKGWLYSHLKGSTVPVVTLGAGAAGAGAGFLALGPIGAAVGGAAAAFIGYKWITG